MEFMGFHTIDIIIAILILFLAIKGLINGFSKEILNFIAIVGGISLAANFNTTVVNFINEKHIIPTITDSYAKIVGFIIIIVSVWLIISIISSIISRFSSDSISTISRIFGYIVSATRYFIIFSLIIFGFNQLEPFKSKTKKFETKTKLFIPMSKIGATILNIDLNSTKIKDSNTSTTNKKTNNILKKSSIENERNNTYTIDSNKDKINIEKNNSIIIEDKNSSIIDKNLSTEYNLTE